MARPSSPQPDQAVLKEAVDDFDRFEYFFESRWQQLIVLCVVAVVLVGGGSWGISAYRAKQLQAAVELGEADTPAAIRAAVTKHARHPAAGYARLRLVRLLLDAGKADEALTEVRALLAASPALPDVKWRARLNEGCLLETLGRDGEAAAAYAALGQELEQPEFVRDEANVNAARIYLAMGKPDQAKTCLQAVNLQRKYTDPGIFWVEQAKTLLKRIP